MLRDLTMIFAVFISVISVAFGFYKNIEANNTKAFAYEQAYQIMNFVPASLRSAALAKLAPPPPVIDLSRSSADIGGDQTCSTFKQTSCTTLAADVAQANLACAKKVPGACDQANVLQRQIVTEGCIACFK